jgi:hypothetical protein
MISQWFEGEGKTDESRIAVAAKALSPKNKTASSAPGWRRAPKAGSEVLNSAHRPPTVMQTGSCWP